MKFLFKKLPILLAVLLLQACATPPNKQTTGTLLGGATGALLGAQFGKGKGQVAAAGIGAVIGALAGGQIGAHMDEQDRQLAAQASQQALESSRDGREISWRNPNNGHSGSIVPTRTYNRDGAYYREYQQTVVIGGKKQKAYGLARRQPDGQWEIVK